MSLSRLREVVEGTGAWRAAGRGVTERPDSAPEPQQGAKVARARPSACGSRHSA